MYMSLIRNHTFVFGKSCINSFCLGLLRSTGLVVGKSFVGLEVGGKGRGLLFLSLSMY